MARETTPKASLHRLLTGAGDLLMLDLAMLRTFIICLAAIIGTGCFADPAEIIRVDTSKIGGSWRFDVTLRHADTGWDDYADGWRVETTDGAILGTRELLHPHVEEQPFTRSLGGVEVPDGISELFIRARTNVTGWDDDRTRVALD